MTRRRIRLISVVATVALALAADGLSGQQAAAPQAGSVDAATRAQVIDLAVVQLRKAYIFADKAEQMAEAVRMRAAKKEYDGIADAREFAEKLTRDLQEVSRDKHLRIRYAAEGLPPRPERPTADEQARALADERRGNFGIERVERLDGNVGYIDLRGFSGSPESRDAAVAAMNFVADTDALIFDLRRNGGGAVHGRHSQQLPVFRCRASQRLLRARDQRASGVRYPGGGPGAPIRAG